MNELKCLIVKPPEMMFREKYVQCCVLPSTTVVIRANGLILHEPGWGKRWKWKISLGTLVWWSIHLAKFCGVADVVMYVGPRAS